MMHALRSIRESKGWTQTELAERIGLPPSAVGHWEAGRREPSWSNAVALARALNVSLDALAGRSVGVDHDAKWRSKIAALLDT